MLFFSSPDADKVKSMNKNRKNADGEYNDFEISPAFCAEKKSAVYNVWQVFKHNLLKPQEMLSRAELAQILVRFMDDHAS